MSNLRSVATQDGGAILDTQQGTITTLNPTGTFVWQGLKRGQSAEDIVNDLARETGMPPNAIEHDVLLFIGELRERKLHP
jgi:hypothetical protein